MKNLTKLLAQTAAAVAIALFWCISAVGTTVGITTLATAINAATSTPAEARRWRGRRRGRGWRGGGYGGYPYYGYGYRHPYYGYRYPYYYRPFYRPGIWFGW